MVKTQKGEKFGKYAGNLNSKFQLSWANTFSYKDFSLYILINGRIGGKVISLTEGYLDSSACRNAQATHVPMPKPITSTPPTVSSVCTSTKDATSSASKTTTMP